MNVYGTASRNDKNQTIIIIFNARFNPPRTFCDIIGKQIAKYRSIVKHKTVNIDADVTISRTTVRNTQNVSPNIL